MQKALILLIVSLNWSCTSRIFLYDRASDLIRSSAKNNIIDIIGNNISLENYFIEKADLEIKKNNSTSKFIFTGKYEKPDKFLFSIKSMAGTEGARIYITKDTILINDRIQKRLLYGNTESLEKIIGLPYYFINTAFGDLIMSGDIEKEKEERINNQLILLQKFRDKTIKSILEPKINKVKSVIFSSGSKMEEISLEYSKFSSTAKHFPVVIVLKDYNRNIEAKIRLKKMKIPWNGTIEFVPGHDYKMEEIK